MKLFIDGDGCPVVDACVQLCNQYQIECFLICDTSHDYQMDDVEVCYVDKGKDCSDFEILKRCDKLDIVVTQDYGLAALALAKGTVVLHPNGFEYDKDNILRLLTQRGYSKKYNRYQHMRKRNKDLDLIFMKLLEDKLLEVSFYD